MTRAGSEAAWADFWRHGGAGPESGCLPLALRAIDAVQTQVWQDLARSLRRGARVLDLATGDGAVLGKMRRARSDLKLTGVDSSPVLPRGARGIELKPSTPMEDLPFADRAFDLVTSQFGFEYGDTERISRQIYRVLRPDGSFAFIVHHAEGRIVGHNAGRAEVLAWASRESGILEKAEGLVRARAVANIATPALFRDAPTEARRRFPAQSAGEEFLTAVLQTLELGRRARARESLEVLATLRAKADNEISRIEALRGAARTQDGIIRLAEQLRSAGLEVREPTALREDGEGQPFAWHLQGIRPAEPRS